MPTNYPHPTLADLRADLAEATAMLARMVDHPYAGHCGEADAVGDRIADLRAEVAALEGAADRRARIARASAAYARTRDGDPNDRDGNPRPRGNGPTAEAVAVFERIYAAHMSGEPIALDGESTSVLWAEIVRRTSDLCDLRGGLPSV